MKINLSKITIGTAQLGFNYGIANVIGKPDFDTAIKILKTSWDHGISSFDTAPAYGNSEEIIGTFISSNLKKKLTDLIITSKLPSIEMKGEFTFNNLYSFIRNQVNKSIKNLRIKKIPIYLIHRASDLILYNELLINCLKQVKNEGLIDRFGISAYNPEDVEISLKFKEIDVIQVPINIFDHRLIKSGLLAKLNKNNYLIFARSIYLQGLFFLQPEKLPKNLIVAKEPLIKLRNLINEYKIDIAKLAFLYIRDLPEISSLVIGVEKIEQIINNIKLLEEKSLQKDLSKRISEEFSNISEKIINPSLWNK